MYSRQMLARGSPTRADRLVPVRLEVGHPAVQGPGVVLPEGLDVADLEPAPLHGPDHLGHVSQLAVGEDVAADEGPAAEHRAARLGDGMVEQATGRRQQPAESLEVRGPCVAIRRARTCRSRRWRRTAHLAGPGSPGAGSPPDRRARPRPHGAWPRRPARGSGRPRRRVAPWCRAAWMAIEPHPHPTSSSRDAGGPIEAQLAADEFVLGGLGLLEGGLGRSRTGRTSRSCSGRAPVGRSRCRRRSGG